MRSRYLETLSRSGHQIEDRSKKNQRTISVLVDLILFSCIRINSNGLINLKVEALLFPNRMSSSPSVLTSSILVFLVIDSENWQKEAAKIKGIFPTRQKTYPFAILLKISADWIFSPRNRRILLTERKRNVIQHRNSILCDTNFASSFTNSILFGWHRHSTLPTNYHKFTRNSSIYYYRPVCRHYRLDARAAHSHSEAVHSFRIQNASIIIVIIIIIIVRITQDKQWINEFNKKKMRFLPNNVRCVVCMPCASVLYYSFNESIVKVTSK